MIEALDGSRSLWLTRAKKSSVNKQWHPAEWSGSFHSYVCADMLVKVQYVGKNIKHSYIMQLKELRRQQLQLAWRRGYSADIPPPMCSNSTGITPLDNSPSGRWVRVLLFHPSLGARGRLSPPEHTEEIKLLLFSCKMFEINVWERVTKVQFLSKHQVNTSLPPDLKQYWHGGHPLPVWCVLLTRQIYIVNRRYSCWLNTICFLIDSDPRQGWKAQNLQLQQTSVSESSAFTGTCKFSVEMHECALTDDVEWL